jgi:hemerythrin
MAMLAWNPAWETGNGEIDHQHRELLGRIERLFKAIVTRQNPGEVGRVLTFLSVYVEEHFGMEERLMHTTAYPDWQRHNAAHDALRARVAEFVAAQTADPGALSDEVAEFLSDWLFSHIDGNDRALAKHLQSLAPDPREP